MKKLYKIYWKGVLQLSHKKSKKGVFFSQVFLKEKHVDV